jgi:tRNA-splicing ligase RtcB
MGKKEKSSGAGFKYLAERVSADHYVLSRRGAMCCDVHAFLSGPLYEASEEEMWRQAAKSAETPGAVGLYLMPDCHLGFGIPVGGVLVTDDVIVQAGSGYDISCGVVYLEVPGLHASDIADPATRRAWVNAIEARVATGIGSRRPALAPSVDRADMSDILRYGAKAIGVSADVCERQYIPVSADFDDKAIPKALDKAAPQLGSVGGGNHFIEMQVDRDDGSVWIMVHCGSRGFGWQTANHFFYEGAALRGLPPGKREESWLHATEPLGKRYWAHHNAAANYAIANRHSIVLGVREATRLVYRRDPEVYFEISHNLVQEETVVLPDGRTKKGFVHRKGATRAFPAGHPALRGTRWEATGHPCLIPGSMRDGAAILFPKANASRSGFSVNHGSGRLMARGEAKRQLEPRQAMIDHEMKTLERELGGVTVRGIVGNTPKTPLDECGEVYKDLDEVLAVLEREGIAEVHRRLYPVANLKGTD